MYTRRFPMPRRRERIERRKATRTASVEAVSQEQVPEQEQALNQESTPFLEIIDRTLDKGLIIDAWARVPVAGLDVLTIEARVFVASCERYLRYADAVAQTPLVAQSALPSAETANVIAAPVIGGLPVGPVQDDTAQVDPEAVGAARVGPLQLRPVEPGPF